MNNTDYNINSIQRNQENLITSLEVEYRDDTIRLETDEQSKKERGIGHDDIVYSSEQSYGLTESEELLVPEPQARGNEDEFIQNVLSKTTETDQSEQWAVQGLSV